VILTLYTKVEWNLGAGWVDITQHAISCRAELDISGNRANALAFGDSTTSKATVELSDALAASNWKRKAIRITFKVNGVERVFQYLMVGRRRARAKLTFRCEDFTELLRKTKVYSPLFILRPVATKTTAASQEDPDAGGYVAGAMNFLFWRSGGRPLEQNGNVTYQNEAKFWYSCDHAILAPAYSWVAGENGYDEAIRLCQASGGMLYQTTDGTIRYRQPYAIADATPTFVFDESVYGDVEEEEETDQLATQVNCAYVPRDARPMQDIVDDSTVRIIAAGESKAITIDPQWPLRNLEISAVSPHLLPEALVVAALDGRVMAQTLSGGYSHTLSWSAQRVVITITDTAGVPIAVWRVKLRGEPITAGEGGSVQVGTAALGEPILTLADSPLIQNEDHARRLCQMVLQFYSAPRPMRKAKDCAYMPERTLGETVNFTRARWSETNRKHVVVGIHVDKSGRRADYDLIPVDDLPVTSDFYQVGTNYTGVPSKKVGY
jgi:hypothetical protein